VSDDLDVAVAPEVYLTLKSVTVVRSLLKLVRKGIEACGVFLAAGLIEHWPALRRGVRAINCGLSRVGENQLAGTIV
jgi:hypothetical protein